MPTAAEVAEVPGMKYASEAQLAATRDAVFSWDDCIDCIARGDLGVQDFGRSPAQMGTYILFQINTREKYCSVVDYVLETIFGYPVLADSTDGNKLQVQRPAVGAGGDRIIWRVNDFPYFLEPEVEHHCVWFERGDHTQDELDAVIEEHRPADVYHTAYWINPRHLMSIPELHHVHVLSKSR